MQQTRQLANAPLVFVVAAVRFEPLEALPNWIPAIQDEVRKTLPAFRRIRQTPGPFGIEMAVDPQDFDPSHPGAGWLFSTSDHKTTMTLFKAGLVLHTTNYSVFSNFADLLGSLVEALQRSAAVLNVNHIGVRYIDHIQPRHGMDVTRFIVSSMLPQQALTGLFVQNSSSFASYRSAVDGEKTILNVRFTLGEGSLVIPQDLLLAFATNASPSAIHEGGFEVQTLEAGGGVLDLDAVNGQIGGEALNAKEIVAEVDRLHRVANDYFDAVITGEARRAWSAST
ncbi:TIGR04255 family protein [uncultured Xanthomonas sp.]|uniref:TIGR04255 family protein n=1 Tax=Xanthomonas sontii TaxID=2650745 RepID=UPI0025EACBC9|nr:TIGR04255 family protein [uncultured Xanthomonas sp.]